MERILAIDKDIAVHTNAAAKWSKYGISIHRVETMHEAVVEVKQGGDFLFVGINEDSIPDFLSLLPVLRDVTEIPIFVMSSSYTIDKNIRAMAFGADSYDHYHACTEHNVLMALEWLKAQKRWKKQANRKLNILACGNIILSKSQRKAFAGGVEVSLGKKEFDILQFLMENYGCVVEHKQLLREIWGDRRLKKDADPLWRTINRLRTKLSEQHPAHECIKIDRGVGYAFEL